MDERWLRRYLDDATDNRLCTTPGCTTCGSGPFRQGLLLALAEASGEPVGGYRDRRVVRAIGLALARLAPSSRPDAALSSAIRRILLDLWSGDAALDAELVALLRESWAGRMLASMHAHHAAVQAERAVRAAYESPAAVALRRDEKRRLKQPARDARAIRKAEGDRLWRARQEPPT